MATYEELLRSGMSRQQIRQAIIDQRKGTSERAAERKAAEQVRKQEFSTIQQAQEFYGNVPQNVLRRTAGFKAIKEAQDKRISEINKSLEEIDTKIQQREQKKLSKQKANEWDSDDQDDFEEDIADLKAQKQGFTQGQQRLEKGEIIPTSKIQSYARDLGGAASREERARNIRGKQERQIARQLGFSGRQSYRQAKPTLKKLQRDKSVETFQKLPSGVQETLQEKGLVTIEEIPADTKQGITEQSQVTGGIRDIIREREITSDTAKITSPGPSGQFDIPQNVLISDDGLSFIEPKKKRGVIGTAAGFLAGDLDWQKKLESNLRSKAQSKDKFLYENVPGFDTIFPEIDRSKTPEYGYQYDATYGELLGGTGKTKTVSGASDLPGAITKGFFDLGSLYRRGAEFVRVDLLGGEPLSKSGKRAVDIGAGTIFLGTFFEPAMQTGGTSQELKAKIKKDISKGKFDDLSDELGDLTARLSETSDRASQIAYIKKRYAGSSQEKIRRLIKTLDDQKVLSKDVLIRFTKDGEIVTPFSVTREAATPITIDLELPQTIVGASTSIGGSSAFEVMNLNTEIRETDLGKQQTEIKLTDTIFKPGNQIGNRLTKNFEIAQASSKRVASLTLPKTKSSQQSRTLQQNKNLQQEIPREATLSSEMVKQISKTAQKTKTQQINKMTELSAYGYGYGVPRKRQPRKPKPFWWITLPKGRKLKRKRPSGTITNEFEVLPQGFTAAQLQGRARKKITQEQALRLSRSPTVGLGIRGAYEIVENGRPTVKRPTKKKARQFNNNFEIAQFNNVRRKKKKKRKNPLSLLD